MAWIGTSTSSAKKLACSIFTQVTQRLQTWRNNIATKACEVVERFIKVEHKDDLPTKEHIADQIEAHLEKKPVYPGSELYTYAYQWAEWNDGVNSKVS